MSKSKRCLSCNTRPVTKDSPESQLCSLCLTEAEWANEHSDYGHEGIESLTLAQTNLKTQAALDAYITETLARTEECWVCNPSLNKANEDYTEKNGSSRKGIVMTVTRTATGREKANQVAAQMSDYATSISTRKGVVTLKAAKELGLGLVLRWSVEGSYLYDESSAVIDGKTRKVRNVSEALRLVQA